MFSPWQPSSKSENVPANFSTFRGSCAIKSRFLKCNPAVWTLSRPSTEQSRPLRVLQIWASTSRSAPSSAIQTAPMATALITKMEAVTVAMTTERRSRPLPRWRKLPQSTTILQIQGTNVQNVTTSSPPGRFLWPTWSTNTEKWVTSRFMTPPSRWGNTWLWLPDHYLRSLSHCFSCIADSKETPVPPVRQVVQLLPQSFSTQSAQTQRPEEALQLPVSTRIHTFRTHLKKEEVYIPLQQPTSRRKSIHSDFVSSICTFWYKNRDTKAVISLEIGAFNHTARS